MSAAPRESELFVAPDAAALAEAVAMRVAEAAAAAIAERGRYVVALAGGSTPRAAYEALARPPLARRVDWSRVHVIFGDERCVPPEDPRSNYRMAREALLGRVPIPLEQVHRICGEDDPRRAAVEYERILRELLGSSGAAGPPRRPIDTVLLGMGKNGHTASLFPGQPSVREPVRWVLPCFVPELEMWRITLTPVALNAARETLFVIAGEGKAAMLRRVLEGARDPLALPAQAIHPAGTLRWMVDAPAASLLGSPPPPGPAAR